MILQKKTINNVPTLVPLTADTGSGVPVGTVIGQYKKVNIPGYLYLDGSTFDQTLYPALYAYLGTNVLPDYREFVLVGAEQNTTSATIHDHDVFTQGQEKDDQLQDHKHYLTLSPNTSYLTGEGNYKNVPVSEGSIQTGVVPSTYRNGTTTRTKEKAVFWYIKATTGIIESEATEILNLYNEQNSYSTSEINTGKTWIDGKPIYRKTFTFTNQTFTSGVCNIGYYTSLKIGPNNFIRAYGVVAFGNTWITSISSVYASAMAFWVRHEMADQNTSNTDIIVTFEYTKTTD